MSEACTEASSQQLAVPHARVGARGVPEVRRRFTVLDAMILVFATALGLAVCRADRHVFNRGSWSSINLLTFIVAPWTVSVTVMRLLDPRPALRSLLKQPGTITSLIATVFIVAQAAYHAVTVHANGFDWEWNHQLARDSGIVGVAVVVAWFTFNCLGLKRIGPTWLDRLGRLLCIYWVFTFLFGSWYRVQELVSSLQRAPIPVAGTPVWSGDILQQPQTIDMLPQPPEDLFSVAGGRSFGTFEPSVHPVPGARTSFGENGKTEPPSVPVRAKDGSTKGREP